VNRLREQCELVSALNDDDARLVLLLGPPQAGKSALLRDACAYMQERGRFARLVFVDAQGCGGLAQLRARVLRALERAGQRPESHSPEDLAAALAALALQGSSAPGNPAHALAHAHAHAHAEALLVLDNVGDALLQAGEAVAALRALLLDGLLQPCGERVRVLAAACESPRICAEFAADPRAKQQFLQGLTAADAYDLVESHSLPSPQVEGDCKHPSANKAHPYHAVVKAVRQAWTKTFAPFGGGDLNDQLHYRNSGQLPMNAHVSGVYCACLQAAQRLHCLWTDCACGFLPVPIFYCA
jgi:hypothetical protein